MTDQLRVTVIRRDLDWVVEYDHAGVQDAARIRKGAAPGIIAKTAGGLVLTLDRWRNGEPVVTAMIPAGPR